MFGSYIALERLVDDSFTWLNRLRIAYDKLTELEPNNDLLDYLEIKKLDEISPRPDICPINFNVKYKPKIIQEYKLNKETDINAMLSSVPTGLKTYISDLEKAIESLDINSQEK